MGGAAGEIEPKPTCFAVLGAGIHSAVRAWRGVLLLVLLQIALALTVVLPLHERIAPHLDRHAHAPALAGEPDAHDRSLGWVDAGLARAVFAELQRVEAPAFDSARTMLFFVVVLAWFSGAFAAGGFLGTARLRGKIGAGEFLVAGARHAFPLLRVGIVFAVCVLLAMRGIYEVWGASRAPGEYAAASSDLAWWSARLRDGVFVLVFFWLRAAADSGRAALVAGRRRSASLAVIRGLAFPLRRPLVVATLGLATALLAWGLPAAVRLALPLLEAPHAVAYVAVFLAIQVAVAAVWLGRGVWLGGLAALVVPPGASSPGFHMRAPVQGHTR